MPSQNSYAPYRVSIYNLLAEWFGYDNFLVLWCEPKAKNRFWFIDYKIINFRYKFLEYKKIGNVVLNKSLWSDLNELNPEVVILTGYSKLKDYIGLLWAKIRRRRVILWFGCHHKRWQNNSILYKKVKYNFLKLCDGYLTYGSYATKILQEFGIQDKKIVTGCNIGHVTEIRDKVFAIRDKYQSKDSDTVKIISIGQLTKRKGFDLLIKALGSVKSQNWKLLIIGEGEDNIYA